MTPRPLVAAAILAVALAACAGEEGTTAPADSGAGGGRTGTVVGRSFLSTSVTGHTLVEGTRVRLDFEEGSVGASAGCNTLGGTLEVEDDRLVVSTVGGTEMGCDPARHDQDAWLSEFLAADPSYALAGDRLTLSGGGTRIELLDEEAADPDRPVEGTTWRLDGIVEGEAVSSVPAGTGVTVVFEGGRVSVTVDGCDEARADAEVGDGRITFGAPGVAAVECDDGGTGVRQAVLAVMEGEVGYEADGRSLTLSHPAGRGLAFRAG